MKVGVVGVQGAVSEHVSAFERAFEVMGVMGSAFAVRKTAELEKVDALAIPGGESTTISKLLARFGLYERIRERALDSYFWPKKGIRRSAELARACWS
jgi:5'-phosphate synthase pdxT subunit